MGSHHTIPLVQCDRAGPWCDPGRDSDLDDGLLLRSMLPDARLDFDAALKHIVWTEWLGLQAQNQATSFPVQ